MSPQVTAKLLRQMASEAERGEFTEVLVLTGHNGKMSGGASSTSPDSAFSRAATVVMDSCRAVPYLDVGDAVARAWD